MPKDEFDFDDPMELNGMAFATEEDTTDLMAECFIEEFMRLGHNHKQVLALFRNPYYIGMNMVLEKRGEPFVKNLISEIFARWGRKVDWDECTCGRDHGPKTEVPARISHQKMGSTGDPPVPSGDSPLGTGVTPKQTANFGKREIPPIPSGQWPDGTGESPVLPKANAEKVFTDPMGAPVPEIKI